MKTRVFKAVLIGLVAIAGFGAVVMLLWNALVPSIFGLAAISFWQALGLLALIRILFGGIGGRMHGHARGRLFGGMRNGNPIRDKWMKMTPQEREEFLKKREDFFGHRGFGRRDFFSRGDCDFETKDSISKEDE